MLGDHVHQQGSLVAPDRLRFDFSHPGALRREELDSVLTMANGDVVGDDPVEVTETSKVEADAMGALSLFGEKYGDVVRVVRAGPHSLEFCGGTHVGALGAIGAVQVLSEGSIGSNTRRIFAVTGEAATARTLRRDAVVTEAAELLRTEPEGLVDAVQRLLERQRASEHEIQRLRASARSAVATELVAGASEGAVVAQVDGLSPDDLRALAQSVRQHEGIGAVVLVGSPDGTKVSVVAVTGGDPDATTVAKRVASLVGGGAGARPRSP